MRLSPGTLGAKRQSWSKYNPRDLLRDAIISNPRASEAEIAEIVWETVRNERGYHKPIFDYWFANNYRHFYTEETENGMSVVVTEMKGKARASGAVVTNGSGNRGETARSNREKVETAKKEMMVVLMDHMLSSGKRLRAATFGECLKEGGWLALVGKQGRPNEVVGKHLTEKDLLNLRLRAFKP